MKQASRVVSLMLALVLTLGGFATVSTAQAVAEEIPPHTNEDTLATYPADDSTATGVSEEGDPSEVITLNADESFTFEIETSVTNTTFYLPVSGGLNPDGGLDPSYGKEYSWEVDWGDGSEPDTFTNWDAPNAESSDGIDHDYRDSDRYRITIKPTPGSEGAWLGSFGFSLGGGGDANEESNKAMVVEVSSPLTPSMTRTASQLSEGTAPSHEWRETFGECTNLTMGKDFTFDQEAWRGITKAGDFFAAGMFIFCNGAEFTMNAVFNLPQNFNQVGDNYAVYMFSSCVGAGFTMNDVFTLPQDITLVGDAFAEHMFAYCAGDTFTMGAAFNLPQSVTQAGDYFAWALFSRSTGAAFTMNDVFNLPQSITQVGDYFAGNMFNSCSGAAFTMNDVFNLPQGITQAGIEFAGSLFEYAGGVSFQINDGFSFPLLLNEAVSQDGLFANAFCNLSSDTPQQSRTALSIIGENPVPDVQRFTFLGSNCFTDKQYLHQNWGGDGVLLNQTLVDSTTGVSVTGDMSYHATLIVTKGEAVLYHDNCAACAEIKTRYNKGEIGHLFDISLEGERGQHLTVVIPLGTEQADKKFSVYHCNESLLEVIESVANAQGIVSFKVNSLSPFGLALPKAPAPTPAPVPHPVDNGGKLASTGDGSLGAVLPLALLTLAGATLIGGTLITRRRMS